MTGATTGVVGHPWRADVSPAGDVRPWDGDGTLRWYVAADDRWHVPAEEPTLRRTRMHGTPVVECRLRVPDGDAVQRVWSVADRGGATVVEIENESPLPFAVAFSGRPVVTERPPADVPVQGIELPSDAFVLPVGHHARVRVAIAHGGAFDAAALRSAPGWEAVARGWVATAEAAARLDLPDERLVEAVVAARCDLLLDGPTETDDPAGFVADVAELVRLGDEPGHWLPELVPPLEALARRDDPRAREALDAGRRVALAAGDERAAGDMEQAQTRLGAAPVAPTGPAEVRRGASAGRFIRDVERGLCDRTVVLPAGFPGSWRGADFAVHGLPSVPGSALSFAVRWHGARPAVLWEQAGEPVRLTAPAVAPSWSTDAPSGEALWPG